MVKETNRGNIQSLNKKRVLKYVEDGQGKCSTWKLLMQCDETVRIDLLGQMGRLLYLSSAPHQLFVARVCM